MVSVCAAEYLKALLRASRADWYRRDAEPAGISMPQCGVSQWTTVPRWRSGAVSRRRAAVSSVSRGADRTWPALGREGMFRSPRAGVEFGDVALIWYANQGEQPLVSSRGQLQDHIALGVTDLDAWIDKLRGEGVTLLEEPYMLGDSRAVMIEGPSREALELVEVQ